MAKTRLFRTQKKQMTSVKPPTQMCYYTSIGAQK